MQSQVPVLPRRTRTVEEAAVLLGIGRMSAYQAARKGEIPTIRVGRRVLVPIAALECLLGGGVTCEQEDAAKGEEPQGAAD